MPSPTSFREHGFRLLENQLTFLMEAFAAVLTRLGEPELAAQLKAVGLRVMVDDGNDTLNYRIREGEMAKVPYMAVVGQREANGGTVALRIRGAGKKQE